jgi:type II secretory pathway component GspD/PulD (secretin)
MKTQWLPALAGLMLAASLSLANERTLNFNYKDTDVNKVIADYAKASGQRFLVDPSTKGKISILNQTPVTLNEAYNQLSSALAVNGLAISVQGDMRVVSPARSVQRGLIEVTTQMPELKPERMVTWAISLKHISADDINKQLRILSSKDGELVPFSATNQIIVTDWTSNLHRIAKIIETVDQPSAKGTRAEAARTKKQ